MTEPLEDLAPMLNAQPEGWNAAMGLTFVRATLDDVTAEFTVGPQHLQPYGLVHGGVYAGVIEAICSVGAALDGRARGVSVVGLDNQTSFLHAVREGTLRATAKAITRGRRTQLWEGTITDATGRTVATGRVRLLCLEGGARVAGETVAVKNG